jgi:hypothetical protein
MVPTCNPFRTDLMQVSFRQLDYLAAPDPRKDKAGFYVPSSFPGGTGEPQVLNLLLRTS